MLLLSHVHTLVNMHLLLVSVFSCPIKKKKTLSLSWSDLFLSTLMQLFILLSCSLSVFCNMSQYLCIGRFSATSFQVLGHMKTVCVLILGWILFDSALTVKKVLGMLFAVVGMIVYSLAVEHDKQAKLASHVKGDHVLDEEDVSLLKDKVNSLPEPDLELAQTKSWFFYSFFDLFIIIYSNWFFFAPQHSVANYSILFPASKLPDDSVFGNFFFHTQIIQDHCVHLYYTDSKAHSCCNSNISPGGLSFHRISCIPS